jgi:hypothetical protein
MMPLLPTCVAWVLIFTICRYSIPNGPPGPSPIWPGPMTSLGRAVSCIVPNYRPRHGPIAIFRAGPARRRGWPDGPRPCRHYPARLTGGGRCPARPRQQRLAPHASRGGATAEDARSSGPRCRGDASRRGQSSSPHGGGRRQRLEVGGGGSCGGVGQRRTGRGGGGGRTAGGRRSGSGGPVAAGPGGERRWDRDGVQCWDREKQERGRRRREGESGN